MRRKIVVSNMMRRKLRRLKSEVYFALPFRNYMINAFKHAQISGLYVPKVIYIEVTNQCNAKCYMCPHENMKRGRGHMPWHIFKKIIDESRQFEGRGLKFILHKDGEPLMDPLLFKRIAYIKEVMKKSAVHFNTNAMLLDGDHISHILRSPLDSITFSVDGASAETYERIRRGLKYDVVRSNVDNFFRKKKQSKSRIHVIMQMVVNEHNMHERAEYEKLWSGKADEIAFKNMHNFLVQKTSIHGSGLSKKQLTRCLMPFLIMTFYWNGDVALCCWDYDNMTQLGNIEKDSLLRIFNNTTFRQIRDAMRRMDCKAIKPCNICSQIFGMDSPFSQ
ncbi:radical SAM/SPASM domain-containing protein [Planctomycetota bacterium]